MKPDYRFSLSPLRNLLGFSHSVFSVSWRGISASRSWASWWLSPGLRAKEANKFLGPTISSRYAVTMP